MGDPNQERGAEVNDSTGQGTGFAPVGTSLVMAKTLEVRMEQRPNEVNIITSNTKGIKHFHKFFVDDLAKPCKEKES